MLCFFSDRRTARGDGRPQRRGRGIVLAGRRHADARGDGVQPGRAGAAAHIPGGADRRVRGQGEAGHAHVSRGTRARRVLPVQRRPRGRRHGARGHGLRGPADRRPERGSPGERHQEPRGGVLRQVQLPVSVRGVDVARRDRQPAGQRGRGL